MAASNSMAAGGPGAWPGGEQLLAQDLQAEPAVVRVRLQYVGSLHCWAWTAGLPNAGKA